MEKMKSVNDSTQLADVRILQDDVISDNAVLEDEKKTISKLECENVLKVDEFGRYLRESPADSGSDDSRYRRTGRLNSRDRSRSRSRSPSHRRSRRRRSPRRLRGRRSRSRSRSRSPRQRRRSRSKSPIIRRSGEFGGGNMKRDNSHCFDFSRGRCYRGGSCRYIHHESNRNATSRRFQNKHDLEVDSHENNFGVNEGLKNISPNVSDYQHGGVRSQDVDLFQNVNGQEVEPRKEDSVRNAVVCSTSGFGNQLVNNDQNNFERFRKAASDVQETSVVREEHKTLAHNNDSSQIAVNSHHISASYVSDSSFDKNSMISATANMVSSSEPVPYVLPSSQQQSASSSVGLCLSSEQPPLHSVAHQEIRPHSSSSVEVPLHTYQLPPPPPPVASHSQGEKNVSVPQIPMGYGVTQQSAFFPFEFTSRGQFEHYPAPFHSQNFQFNLPPNRTSLPLPPPPPPQLAVKSSGFSSGVAVSYISEEFNQRQLHSTNFASQTSMSNGLPSHSQSSESLDQSHTSMQDPSRTFMLKDASSPKHLPQGNPASQLLSGSNLHRDDRHRQLSMQDSSSQQQQSIYNFPYSTSEIKLGVPGENLTVSRFPGGVLDNNHMTSLHAFGTSQISAHYNPYASTFEQPLSSKFSSSIFRQENDIIHSNNYGSSVMNHAPITREGVCAGGGSRQSASSPKSARVDGQMLPKCDGSLYDPLFDCIEPSSSLKKYNFDKKPDVTGESNISPRPKSSSMSLDTDEKNKREDVASTTSQSNDEYGETADAEVDVANITPGEVEINQIKSPGKRKKSKDSRSMKLFKISIANFVKDVLKPSWQQGNMSKVAFKTIVKKTVDKVSGAMEGHHVPKSQVKISQYIDSSQRKLTKLVMGYVDKYVKM